MLRLEPHLWLLLLGLGSACSLHSLERLDRCRGEPVSSDCPEDSPQAGTGPLAGGQNGGGGGSASAGTSATGGSDPEGGGGAGMSTPGGSSSSMAGEAGAGGVPVQLPDLVVFYADSTEGDYDPAESTQIRAAFIIENRSDVEVPLQTVTLRYYYKLENASEQDFICDYAADPGVVNDCAGIQMTFGTTALPSTSGATHYAQISFAPPAEDWVLPALGGKSGLMRLRFFKKTFSVQDQTNDYSFRVSASNTPTEEQDHVTLYIDGQLAYGIEPQ